LIGWRPNARRVWTSAIRQEPGAEAQRCLCVASATTW
jgi:hypothetical protein